MSEQRQFPLQKFLAAVFILLLLVGLYYFPFPSEAEYLQEFTIIHTNDIHGQIVPSRAEWYPGPRTPEVGGMAKLGTFLQEERAEAYREDRPLLYIDAADFFTGTPESDLLDGKPVIEGLNAVDLDYTTLGNHEFDIPPELLKNRIDELEADVISSNVRYGDTDTPFPGTEKYKVAEHGGIEIGFFGLVADYTPNMALPENIEGIIFLDEIETARKMVGKLKEKEVDLIVGITHIGFESDAELARSVEGIDVLVGGHSHSRLEDPRRINGTIIVQAGSDLTNAGRLDLTFSGEEDIELSEYRGGLVTLYDYRYRADSEVEQRLQPYLDRVEDELSRVVGKTITSIERDPTETSPLGNLVTDVMRRSVGADLAFQNAFGIRDNLPAGEITRREVFSVLPFQNYIVELELKGETIRRIFEGIVRGEEDIVTQFSGARVEVDYDRPEGERVTELQVGGEPLDEEKKYTVATSNFLVYSGEGMEGLSEAIERRNHDDKLLYKLLERHIEENSPVAPPVEQRLK